MSEYGSSQAEVVSEDEEEKKKKKKRRAYRLKEGLTKIIQDYIAKEKKGKLIYFYVPHINY